MVAAAESGTIPSTTDGTENDIDTEEPTMDDTATDPPSDEAMGKVTEEEDKRWEGGWTKASEVNDEDGPGALPYGIMAGVLAALLALVVIRRRTAKNAKRRKHRAELIAEEYKDNLELPEMS